MVLTCFEFYLDDVNKKKMRRLRHMLFNHVFPWKRFLMRWYIMCRLRCLIIYKISADPDNMVQGGCYLVKHAANQCSKQFNVDGLLNRILLLLLQRGALDLFMWGNIDGKQRKTKLKWKLFCIDTVMNVYNVQQLQI